MSVFFIFAANGRMILIVGKYQLLADCVADKFCAMGLGDDVQVRNTARLVDFLTFNHQDISLLIYVDKRRDEETEDPSRIDYLQLLWTITAKHSIPFILLSFKYDANYMIDEQMNRFSAWVAKQYRRPPFFYLLKLEELYGTGDRVSALDEFYRQIERDGVVSIVRQLDEHGDVVERQLDYVYVKDVLRVLYWFVTHRPENGVYELGSGFPRTDTAVANAIFRTLKQTPNLQYIEETKGRVCPDWPVLNADLTHLRRVGYKKPFYPVEKGVKSYIQKSFFNKDRLPTGC